MKIVFDATEKNPCIEASDMISLVFGLHLVLSHTESWVALMGGTILCMVGCVSTVTSVMGMDLKIGVKL